MDAYYQTFTMVCFQKCITGPIIIFFEAKKQAAKWRDFYNIYDDGVDVLLTLAMMPPKSIIMDDQI